MGGYAKKGFIRGRDAGKKTGEREKGKRK